MPAFCKASRKTAPGASISKYSSIFKAAAFIGSSSPPTILCKDKYVEFSSLSSSVIEYSSIRVFLSLKTSIPFISESSFLYSKFDKYSLSIKSSFSAISIFPYRYMKEFEG